MPLYHQSRVSVESWIEMERDVEVKYEVDAASDCVTLFFGHHNEYVLRLGRENLGQVLELGGRAAAELAAASPDDA